MLQIMILIFIFAGKYTNYKAECSSHHAENTFLCMRLNPRGLTPSETGMNDRQGTRKVKNTFEDSTEKIHPISVRKSLYLTLFFYSHLLQDFFMRFILQLHVLSPF